MGPPGFAPLRRGFGTENSFRSQHFGFGGPPPRFRHMPPIPPPPGPPPMYGPRPFRYGPPPRPALPPPPPRPGFLIPGFPRQPGPNRAPTGARLPPGPPARLPPPKMPALLPPPPPPPPPPSARPRPVALGRLPAQKRKQHIRQIARLVKNSDTLIRRDGQTSRSLRKLLKEQDFTLDTFEENLLTVPGQLRRRSTRGRYHQGK
ncbi:hypothetical protein WN55_02633 [Dufourea novaeangliae]|uniref:Uncharacterized protein n=2 Tax=Dufourea novaeangliae TaxID=178035 RepID=A0A154PHZ0_DUFNO|nr:hypothetical protein WN55_02633 [Dufourea novaeangliae]